MKIIRTAISTGIRFFLPFCFLFALLWFITPASAFEAGKTYDKSNYEEIKDLLAPSILLSIQNGEYTLDTTKLNFDIHINDKYKKLTESNEGKYDISETGNLIEKSTGKPAGFIRGDPFDKIDPKNPKVAEKIMEKFYFNIRCRHGSNDSLSPTTWIGATNERYVVSHGKYLNFTNMPRGPFPNPNNFRSQALVYVEEPYDLRGTVQMSWEYNGDVESTSFAYVPMLRRVRRTSAAARSDPFMGSDSCTDDPYGYAGKNAEMIFKLLGEKELLMPFSSKEIMESSYAPDGGFLRKFPELKAGYQVPGWKYAAYCPVNVYWAVRPVYILEMVPKNDFYNYGSHTLYIDKVQFCIYIKEMYDRSGSYWKKNITPYSYHLTPDGTDLMMTDAYLTQDDKTHHATYSIIKNPYGNEPMIDQPYDKLGPHIFTTAAMQQLSK